MQGFISAALVGLFGVLPAQACAQGHVQGSAQTVWLCGLSADAMRLVCVADAAPQQVQDAAARAVAAVNGTSFPLDPRRLYTVELFTQATEMEFVEQLARSTMCYRTPSCAVTFSGPRVDVALAERRR